MTYVPFLAKVKRREVYATNIKETFHVVVALAFDDEGAFTYITHSGNYLYPSQITNVWPLQPVNAPARPER